MRPPLGNIKRELWFKNYLCLWTVCLYSIYSAARRFVRQTAGLTDSDDVN